MSDYMQLKRMPVSSVRLHRVGDLVQVRSQLQNETGLFKRYCHLYETIANLGRVHRAVATSMLHGMVLTSYAKKSTDPALKRQLFAMKNKLLKSLIQNKENKPYLKFKYLISRNFKVTEYCERCAKQNGVQLESADSPNTNKARRSFCAKCKVDKNFYNVLCVRTEFDDNYIHLFLSQDQLQDIDPGICRSEAPLIEIHEEARIGGYRYDIKNMDAIAVEDVQSLVLSSGI